MSSQGSDTEDTVNSYTVTNNHVRLPLRVQQRNQRQSSAEVSVIEDKQLQRPGTRDESRLRERPSPQTPPWIDLHDSDYEREGQKEATEDILLETGWM